MTHGLVSGAWPRTWPSLTRSARHLCMHTTTAAALSRKLRGSDSPRAGLSPGTEDPSSFCLPMHPFVYPRGGSTPPLWPLYVPLCTTHSHSLGQNSVMGLPDYKNSWEMQPCWVTRRRRALGFQPTALCQPQSTHLSTVCSPISYHVSHTESTDLLPSETAQSHPVAAARSEAGLSVVPCSPLCQVQMWFPLISDRDLQDKLFAHSTPYTLVE